MDYETLEYTVEDHVATLDAAASKRGERPEWPHHGPLRRPLRPRLHECANAHATRSVTLARDTYTDDRLDRFEVEAQNRWVELGGHPEDVQLAVERRELALGGPAVPAGVAGTPAGRRRRRSTRPPPER